jgi:hypothetical protein
LVSGQEGEIVPGKGRVVGYDEKDRAIYEPVPGVAYDEEGNPIAIPLETTQTGKEIDERMAAAAQSLERIRALEEEKARKDAEIATLKRQLEEREKAAATEAAAAAASAAAAATGEKQEAPPEEGPASKAVREFAEQWAARRAEGSLGERIELAMLGELRGLNRWWWSTRAAYAKAKLEDADAKIKDLDDAERAFLNRKGTPMAKGFRAAVSPVWHGLMGGKWYGLLWKGRWHMEKQREDFAAALDRYNRYKVRREKDLFAMHDVAAARKDALISDLKRDARIAKKTVDDFEAEIAKFYKEHDATLKRRAETSDALEFARLNGDLNTYLGIIAELDRRRSEAEGEYNEVAGRLADVQGGRDGIISQRDQPFPSTTGEIQHEELGKKPGQRINRLKSAA